MISSISYNKRQIKLQLFQTKDPPKNYEITPAVYSYNLQTYPDSKNLQNKEIVTGTRRKSKKMVYTYTPTYYSSLHDSITSLCKTILPFSFKKRRLIAVEHRLAKLQSDNLKWQQDSYHQILNLMGLHKEGILDEAEVSAFRSNLLETLIASPAEQEQPVMLRDKLVFLQELLYAKCISEGEYHDSKRPLIQRLAVQGAEIEARDVIVANPKESKENSEEEWSVIDLKDEKCQVNKENLHSRIKLKSNPSSMQQQLKEAASLFSIASSQKKHREEKSIFDIESQISIHSKNHMLCSKENPFRKTHLKGNESETRSILMQENLSNESTAIKGSGGGNSTDKAKRKPFRTLFHREQKEGQDGGENGLDLEETGSKSAKKQWGFEGFKKWKRNDSEHETAPLPLNERSDSEAYLGSCKLVSSPVGEGPNTRELKKKLHSNGAPSDFFIDKVLGDKIKELSRIQSELGTTNPNMKFSNDQIEAISTKLPVDKADLKRFFPKSWCDRYGDVVLDVVKKELKDHVGEIENRRNAVREKYNNNSMPWITFDDDDDGENCSPNLFAQQDHHSSQVNQQKLPAWNEDRTNAYHSGSSSPWITFDDDNDGENCPPNLFAQQDHHSSQVNQQKLPAWNEDRTNAYHSGSSSSKNFENNPIFQFYCGQNGNNLRSESVFSQDQNQSFPNPISLGDGSSLLK